MYTVKDGRDVTPPHCLPGLLLYPPWDAATLDVSFKLYDNLNRDAVKVLRWDETFPVNDLVLGATDKLVVIIHGYTENPDEAWINRMRDAYFRRPEIRSIKWISVDWEKGALGSTLLFPRNYVQASSNARAVGMILGTFLGRLMMAYDIGEESLHILGHSLGAHVMGGAIEVLHRNFNIKAGRATG
ncbi:inactive pancreatic lipase-related protein 1-like [Galendromus occidentalis]|uniref:Inactive pancreatic lipase-related protein 1-like n=1 Tax=Galendromus occidentalis TaxID=34638 RepID=A0AAJ6QU91_9ACAR|nr:inactive pancreatic lipase-related protein 1-like [Galendromus occidentalis]